MDTINRYRSIIDIIDKEMIRLFEQRMKLAHKIGVIKMEKGLEVYNGDREDEVIEKCISYLDDEEFEDETTAFLKNLMKISAGHQEKLMRNQ